MKTLKTLKTNLSIGSIVVGMLFVLVCSCKQNQESQKREAEQIDQKATAKKKRSPIITELERFVDTIPSVGSEDSEIFVFKEIDANGAINTINTDQAVALYEDIVKHKQVTSLPIFEIKNTDTAILLVKSNGFGGAIWAKVWVDRGTLEIKSIEFDHKAETDGYGAAMTQTSFESQFAGTKINFDKNSFDLQSNMEKGSDNDQMIEGISGATITSEAVVEMVNVGLLKYRDYLEIK